MYLDTNYKFAASQVARSKHFSLHGEYMFIYIGTDLKGIEGAPNLVKRGEIGASERLSRTNERMNE